MKSMRRWGGVTFMFLTAAMFLVGCPDDGVIKDGLVIIDDFPQLDIEQIKEDFIAFFTGVESPLEVGDIIIGSEAGGFLRRIIALGEDGSDIFAQTEISSLCEAVENGIMLKDFQFSSADLAAIGLGDGSVTLIDVSGKDLYRDYGVAVTIQNGTLDCVPTVNLAASFDNHRLQTFDLSATGDFTLNLDLRVGVDNKTPVTFETNIIPPIVHPFAASIGPVPIYGTAKLQFPIGITGTFDGETYVQTGFDVSDTFTVTANFADGNWTHDATAGELVFDGHPLIWNIDVGANIQVYVKPTVSISLYEALDLSLFAKPYITADIDIIPSPTTINLGAGIDLGGSYGLRILDWQILGDSFYWNGPSGHIYTWTAAYEEDWSQGSIEIW